MRRNAGEPPTWCLAYPSWGGFGIHPQVGISWGKGSLSRYLLIYSESLTSQDSDFVHRKISKPPRKSKLHIIQVGEDQGVNPGGGRANHVFFSNWYAWKSWSYPHRTPVFPTQILNLTLRLHLLDTHIDSHGQIWCDIWKFYHILEGQWRSKSRSNHWQLATNNLFIASCSKNWKSPNSYHPLNTPSRIHATGIPTNLPSKINHSCG